MEILELKNTIERKIPSGLIRRLNIEVCQFFPHPLDKQV